MDADPASAAGVNARPPGAEPERRGVARSAYGLIVRAALTLTGEHPEVTFRQDALLRSINDRLGALVAREWSDPWPLPGQEVPPLSREYLAELLEFAIANHEDLEADYEERVQEIRGGGKSDLWERMTSGE